MVAPETANARILILAPIGRDGIASADVLGRAGMRAEVCKDLDDLTAKIDADVLAVLLAEEALFGKDTAPLFNWVANQPPWSDLPFVVLTSQLPGNAVVGWRGTLIDSLHNVSLLERPVQTITLRTAMQAAGRARARQYQLRALLEAQKHAAAELEHLVLARTQQLEAANEELRRQMAERARVEESLRQAQRMEAIGQLTGGIAHDFNNLLGVVLGNLQLLERSVTESPSLSRKVHTAMRAVVRGADLTRRLLAFSRKQIFAPAVIDLERQLSGLADLMQRTLGDAIEVRMQAAPGVWHTRVDPGQLENAILNLAINSRDAMPQGGRLTVQIGNLHADTVFCAAHPPLEPGDYVSITVTDTGCGIAPEVLNRVFEPFFTTKESGKGSGLGLAMVHSMAEQAGGVATIESTVGKGTTVCILLPRCDEEQSNREDTIVDKIAPRGDETILVVEDDADLRETVVTSLSQLGYRALAAANADAALRILSGSETVDLLFTDVMMPGGTLGPALAKRARELRPGLDVLYTTGYAEQSVLGHGSGVSPSDVIQKPYRNEDLALRIRIMLDREARVA
ncbi:MAG TPA: ATP-binding protein [Steroidobacteraceae bacterium]|nr:ATP-binding protein [Steroidobacteraceae bacterium]